MREPWERRRLAGRSHSSHWPARRRCSQELSSWGIFALNVLACAVLAATAAAAEKTPNERIYQLNKGADPQADDQALPEAPPGFEVKLVAREPLVRNPCSLAFDDRGRLFVGQGPQYRRPTRATPPDSVLLLHDDNGDGVFDRAKVFATGLNCIQGLAWRGRDLYVANSPDLTIVRDLDGDDEADEYVKLYTDLGNIEHALHGLNFAPDGRLYMSKGNSKGLSEPGRVAPKPFRDLWGIGAPAGSPDLPTPQKFTKTEYKAMYQDPEDDWGREGGVLRCNPDGTGLEIVSRGLRNPWDITFSDTFDWLGTDNDQTPGDRIFSPFTGAHFAWNHVWSAHWTGEGHLPTAPVSGPLFDGSGTGIVFYDEGPFPSSHRGVFLLADWLRKAVYVYRPRWDGALLQPEGGKPEEFIRGGKALFRPTDLGLGPDGALYVLGWGRSYGAEWQEGQQTNEGRVFRVAWTNSPSQTRPWLAKKRRAAIAEWSFAELVEDFSQPIAACRVNAQEELVRRGPAVTNDLVRWLSTPGLATAPQTWGLWTLGRIGLNDPSLDARFAELAKSGTFNERLQSIRILADRAHRKTQPVLADAVVASLRDPDPRLRCAAVLAVREARDVSRLHSVKELAVTEPDRITSYAAWKALAELASAQQLRDWLADSRAGLRRAALLALLETRALLPDAVQPLTRDADPTNAALARLFLEKSGVIEPLASVALAGSEGPPLGPISPPLQTPDKPASLEEAMPLLERADAKRGEQLFLGEGGAGCWMCHRIGERGRAFGPDLSLIGDRNDPRNMVESIVEPNARVTEGFATLSVSTREREDMTGILVEETDSILTLAQPLGPPLRVDKGRITNRQSLHTSPMPSYAEALRPQDVANLAAFLLAQKTRTAADPGPEAKSGSAAIRDKFEIQQKPDQLDITLAGRPFASYVFRHPEVKRPFLAHVRTTSGIQVTRNFPPVEGRDAADHPTMHPGIWFGFGDIGGADFWRNKGAVEHVRFVEEPRGGAGEGSFTALNRYVNGGQTVCEEKVNWRFSVRTQAVLILIESVFTPAGDETYFGDQEEMGLGVRVATPLTVKNGGMLLDSAGRRNQPEIWGKTADWCFYGGQMEGRNVGLLVMPSPANFRSSWMHARDYGVLVANPFGRKAFTGGEPSRVVVKKGESLVLRFGVLVCETASGAKFDSASAYADYLRCESQKRAQGR